MFLPITNVATTKVYGLRIERLSRGGYAVFTFGVPGSLSEAIAAFSDIDDALAFIKDEIGEPEKAEKPHIVTADVTEQVKEKFPPLPPRANYRGIV